MKSRKYYLLIIALFLYPAFKTTGQLRLPKLISEGMVLQRNTNVKIWGWASNNENIKIQFIDSTYYCSANSNGEWQIVIPTPGAGGPYKMQIVAGDSVIIDDILIGDVWICSGQSNMELPMRRVAWVYPNEISESENSQIRQFYVPRRYNFNIPQKDLSSGSWQKANPENVLDFSAVAYFFAKEIYAKNKVPVGIINTSLGGSPVEAWMSESTLKEFPDYYNEAQNFKDSILIQKIENEDNIRISKWYKLLRQRDEGYINPKQIWYKSDLNTADWSVKQIPDLWTDTLTPEFNAVLWFRKKVNIPVSLPGKEAKLILGRIVDSDSVFVNNTFVGATGYQYPPRRYDIPANLLKEGENTIVVRIIRNSGLGGFVTDKPYQIIAGIDTIDLKGEWHYKPGAKMEPLKSQTFIRFKPLGLYNAMIAPLLNFRIKGVIWYQGESNAERPLEYRKLLPALIKNWRNDWKQGEFPFLFVQLPNFNKTENQPSESNWALMRESQLHTLSLPNTGMAVTIDVGEWNDIHPLNKKDVGHRLALEAQRIAYSDHKIVSSGPIYQSMKIKGNKIYLTFKNTGSGLMIKRDNGLKYFSIAGKDKKYVWANAVIKENKVIVWNDSIDKPLNVRYAWADNPEGANFYNLEGLPASPFRTDN